MSTATSALAAAMLAVEIDEPSEIRDSDVESEEDDYDEPSAETGSDTDEGDEAAVAESDSEVAPEPHEDSVRESDSDVESDAPSSGAKRKRDPDRWIKEVKHYQETTHQLLPRAPFRRLVREIGQDFKTDLRWSEQAFEALQESAEALAIEMFAKAQALAIFRERETISPKDVTMAMKQIMRLP